MNPCQINFPISSIGFVESWEDPPLFLESRMAWNEDLRSRGKDALDFCYSKQKTVIALQSRDDVSTMKLFNSSNLEGVSIGPAP